MKVVVNVSIGDIDAVLTCQTFKSAYALCSVLAVIAPRTGISLCACVSLVSLVALQRVEPLGFGACEAVLDGDIVCGKTARAYFTSAEGKYGGADKQSSDRFFYWVQKLNSPLLWFVIYILPYQ